MKFFKFLPLALACSLAFANEENANQRISVYLHPFSLALGLGNKEMPLFLYITGEYPLSGSNSLIIDPSIWTGGDGDFLRIGTGVGIRHFASGEASGLYLQAMPSIYYLSVDKDITGTMMDILGYIGYSAKYSSISIFFDIGVGYGRFSLSEERDNKETFIAKGLKLDFNIGVGIPF